MSFFAILIAFLLEQARPLAYDNPVHSGLRAWARLVRRNLDAGQSAHGWLAWLLAAGMPALVAGLVYWGLWTFSTVLAFAWLVAVLYVMVGFRQFSHHFTDIRQALETGNDTEAREKLAAWLRVDAASLPRAELLLGRLYYEGKLVPQDPHKAEEHLRKAAPSEPSANYFLGQLYLRGYLGEVYPQQALDHLLSAARNGQINADFALALDRVQARTQLGQCFEVSGDDRRLVTAFAGQPRDPLEGLADRADRLRCGRRGRILAQNGGEQPHQFRSTDGRALVHPKAVAADDNVDVAAVFRMPQVHRRQPSSGLGLDQTRDLQRIAAQ